jgi:hypothetical protein
LWPGQFLVGLARRIPRVNRRLAGALLGLTGVKFRQKTTFILQDRRNDMSKLLSTLIAAAFAVTTFGAAAQTPPAKGDAPKADTQKAEKKAKSDKSKADKKAKGDGAKAKGDGKKAKGDGKKSEKAAAPKKEDTKK